MDLQKRFLDNCVNKCKIQPGKLLVAVSGGPDSVALLHLLLDVRDHLQIEPVVAHVNHSLRPEAGEDEKFCQQLAAMSGLEIISKTVDTKACASTKKMSIETAARELRYQALQEMASQQGCSDIALGHTANDQAETVLHNLSRGTGLRGLAGMPFRHGNIVRPLLTIYKQEILHYLEEQKIDYCKDSTNDEPIFKRNVIRNEVFPHLQEKMNPKIIEALCRVSTISNETDVFINAMAKSESEKIIKEQNHNKIILDIDRFSSYFSILRKYIIRNNLETLSGLKYRPDFESLSRADEIILSGKIGKRILFSGNWELLIDHDGIVLWNGEREKFDIDCNEKEENEFGGNRIFKYRFLSTLSSPNCVQSHDKFIQYVDSGKVRGNLRIRSKNKGDRFYPLGLRGSKSVSDFFTDHKIPLHKRSEIPIVVCDSGIIWIVGLHLDERFKVTDQTTSFLQLEVEEADT